MIEAVRRIVDSPRFQYFILIVIVAGAIVIGVETSAALTARHGSIIVAVEVLIQTIFVVEIGLRILACWPRPVSFFRNGWNLFDFAVVAASVLPQAGAFAMVARLARLTASHPAGVRLPGPAADHRYHGPVDPIDGARRRAADPPALRVRRAWLPFLR